MSGMPELIHRRYRFEPIPAIEQQSGVAREGRRIARHRDDSGNGAFRKLARLRLGALTRRIEHQGIDALELLRHQRPAKQVARLASIGLSPRSCRRGGGDWFCWPQLGAGQRGDHRDRGQKGEHPDRRPPVCCHEPGQAHRGQRQQGDQRDDEKPGSDGDDEGARAADRVAEQPDRGAGVRRVVDGVETGGRRRSGSPCRAAAESSARRVRVRRRGRGSVRR